MGSSEVDKSSKDGIEAKDPKTPLQEQTSAAAGIVATDWSGFQSYSPIPPHGFIGSSPQTHPYMWGVQQFIPPYGTPPHPYVAMYPHGGIYAHPAMPPGSYPFSPFAMPSPNGIAESSGNSPGNMEVDGKSTERKVKLPIKRSKGSSGSLNMASVKNNVTGKTAGASANGVFSKSHESASEGSSEGSDVNSENDSQEKSGDHQDSVEPAQNGNSAHSQNGAMSSPHSVMNQSMPVVPIPIAGSVGGVPGGPTTNLNIGIDYWGTAPSSTIPVIRGKVPAATVVGGMVPTGSRDNSHSQPWMQDERELKRQRRKQSNRESARRSRLRKQAECDELAQRADAMKEENASLRAELARIRSEYEQLLAHNASLKERFGELPLDQDDPASGQDDHQ